MHEDEEVHCELDSAILEDRSHNASASSLEEVQGKSVAEGSSVSDEQDKKPELADCVLQLSRKWIESDPADKKIRLCLDAMRHALLDIPRFKDFWMIRQLCLTFFKESIPPKVRSQLWSDYVEVSAESKRLKEIVDERSAFASEQIELAIQALERGIEQQDILLAQIPDEISCLNSLSMKDKMERYVLLQRQIHLLSGHASRINALRKEVLKTDMRVRQKNKFLSRLSSSGDLVFPKRKEFIHQVSSLFRDDVHTFVHTHFQNEELQKLPIYALREEIKSLQSAGKKLSLGSQTFTETRLLLSQCWDQIKEQEKERKQQIQHKRQVFKQNFDLVMEKIKPFQELCQGDLSLEECESQASEILQFMRSLELGRDEVVSLKEAIFEAKKAPLKKVRYQEIERREKEQQEEERRRSMVKELTAKLEEMLNQAPQWDSAVLSTRIEELASDGAKVTQTKMEKHLLDRLFKQIAELLHEKKMQELLSLPEEDLERLDQLKIALEEHRQRRQGLKKQLENYRKILGGSSLDFEKAMLHREMIESEKVVLEKVEKMIDEIEEKIAEIEM